MPRQIRDKFAPDELAIVLSHYDLGVIESITEFNRGSRRSPKVGIVCAAGKFLLKKRAADRGGADRVAYTHAIQHHLTDKGFPLPKLQCPVGTEDTILTLGDSLYEIFEYVSGHPYSGEKGETLAAGRALAEFHTALDDFPDTRSFAGSGYHDALGVQTGVNAVPTSVSAHDSAAGKDAEVLALTSFLFEAYTSAADKVEHAGYPEWPDAVTHSDWHPGNILYKRGEVLAVIDYDCAKPGKPTCDVANGALQFSIVANGEPTSWPDHLDVSRIRKFLSGYEAQRTICEEHAEVLPYLMIEALIAEAVLPIAATGTFGRFGGFGFMQMVRRKVNWILAHAGELRAVA